MPSAKSIGVTGRKTGAATIGTSDGPGTDVDEGSLMALANLSASISLDDMLSGLEKATGTGSVYDGDSEHGGRAPSSRGLSMSRRSAGKTSIMTRGSIGSRIQNVRDNSIRKQADMEARSYGRDHPSGVASEAARRARATADAVRDASARAAAYKTRRMSNSYVESATPLTVRPPSPRSGASSRASSAGSAGGDGESMVSSPSSFRQPRSTELGPVFCSPKSQRNALPPHSELDVRRMALGPYSTIDGRRGELKGASARRPTR